MQNNYKKASGNGVNSQRVKKFAAAAGVAAMGLCAAVYYENEIDSAYTQLTVAPPRDIEYDADGNEMHLMKYEDFQETFMQTYDEITEENAQTQLV